MDILDATGVRYRIKGDELREQLLSSIGWCLIITGSGLGIVGGIVNAAAMHNLAIDIWLFSNAFLLAWAIGFIKGWWNKKISVEALALMYAVFTVCNVYAIVMRESFRVWLLPHLVPFLLFLKSCGFPTA